MEPVMLDEDEAIERYEKLLNEFEVFLESKKLSYKTINAHLQRLGFYIFNYLINYELYEWGDEDNDGKIGYSPLYLIDDEYLDEFLGDFYIRKVINSSVTNIKKYVATFSKYIDFLVFKNILTKNESKYYKNFLKEEKEEWMEKMRLYDDPEVSIEDIF